MRTVLNCMLAPLVVVWLAVMANPAPGQTVELGLDHAALIRKWDAPSLARGEKLYAAVCITCHGTPEKAGTLPTSRAFWKEPFKNGCDPFSIYKTIGSGTNQMPPQLWMTPEQRYDVIHFLRETFLKPLNPTQYFAVTPEYLATLPKATNGVFQKTPEMLEYERGPKYLRMDFGRALFWTYEVDTNNFAYKGIAMRLDKGPGGISRGRAWMVFDHDTMRWAAGWTGDKFIDWKGIAFDGSHETHTSIVGYKSFINPVGPGWADPATGSFEDPRLLGKDRKPYGPLPREWAHYQGLYLSGDDILVAYTIGDAEVLELAGLETSGGVGVLSRTLNITKSSRSLLARLAPEGVPAFLVGQSPARIIREKGMSLLQIPAASTPLKLKVILGDPGPGVDPNVVYGFAVTSKPAEDLIALKKLATPRSPPIETHGKLGTGEGAFAVDEITVPREDQMPSHSWMRLSGFDFFKHGKTAAVCTWNGDVWLVKGINETLGQLIWQRIASGLFQPLGLKIVDDVIYVACRDQIVRLWDRNGDGAVDFIENFNNDHQVTEHFHEFATGLQTDPAGNFYYAKCACHGRTAVVPQHGTVLKVSPDGRKTEIVAHGFRAINGMCVDDDGACIVTDQEGHWTPGNRIEKLQPGRFYGYMWAYDHPESAADDLVALPLVWIVPPMDRSPAEIVRIPKGHWGALQGALLNVSYGTGQIFLVPYEAAGQDLQGGVVALPLPLFPTGTMRGRFHPQDGQLYTCGLFGWAGNRTADGGFFRVRYTGKPFYLPVGIHATSLGVQLTFTEALDAAMAQDAQNYSVKTWGLTRAERYGSPNIGEKSLQVKSARLSPDHKTVSLEIPEIQPTWCMEIKVSIRAADGMPINRQVHNTIHLLK
jgi:cytochrome c5